jgi:hypothetical protein
MEITHTGGRVDIFASCSGGGLSGQAGAIVMGLGRALVRYDPSLEGALRSAGFMTRDNRSNRRRSGRLRTIEVLFIVVFLSPPGVTGVEHHFYRVAHKGARLFRVFLARKSCYRASMVNALSSPPVIDILSRELRYFASKSVNS